MPKTTTTQGSLTASKGKSKTKNALNKKTEGRWWAHSTNVVCRDDTSVVEVETMNPSFVGNVGHVIHCLTHDDDHDDNDKKFTWP